MQNEEKFSVRNEKKGDINCLFISGYLDAHTAPILEKAIENCVQKGEVKILVHFGQLDYISSAGLGVFMAFIEDVRESNGDIILSNMKEKVFSVFDLLGFPLLFKIVADESEAIDIFNNFRKGN